MRYRKKSKEANPLSLHFTENGLLARLSRKTKDILQAGFLGLEKRISLGSGDLVDCLIELGRSAPLVVMDYDYGIGSFSSFQK
jgi:hypothetical protein